MNNVIELSFNPSINGEKSSVPKIILGLRLIAEQQLQATSKNVLDDLESNLFDWIESTKKIESFQRMMDIARHVRLHNQLILEKINETYVQLFNESRNRIAVTEVTPPSFELVSNNQLEETLAIRRISEICSKQSNDYPQLASRLSNAEPHWVNCIAAGLCGKAFITAFKLTVEKDIINEEDTLVILKFFELQMKEQWPDVFRNQNIYLYNNGVMPKEKPKSYSNTTQSIPSADVSQSPSVGASSSLSAALSLIASLSQENSRPLDIHSVFAKNNISLPYFKKTNVSIIEIVDKTFQRAFYSETASDLIKVILASIQIPIVKYALQNTDFIENNSNEVRLLLNRIIDLGGRIEGSVFTNRYEQAVSAFRGFLESNGSTDFSACNSKVSEVESDHKKHLQTLEDKTKQALINEDRLTSIVSLSKRYIDRAFDKNTIPTFIYDFMSNEWRNIVVQTLYKHGTQSSEWKRLGTITKNLSELLKISKQTSPIDPPNNLGATISDLRTIINENNILETRAREFLTFLRGYHGQIFWSHRLPVYLRSTQITENLMPAKTCGSSMVFDSEIPKPTSQLLIDVEEVDYKSIKLNFIPINLINSEFTKKDADSKYEYNATAQELDTVDTYPLGTQFSIDESGKKCTIKLALYLQTRKVYLFTDNLGRKHSELTKPQFAQMLSLKTLKAISLEPIFERSLESVILSIRNNKK